MKQQMYIVAMVGVVVALGAVVDARFSSVAFAAPIQLTMVPLLRQQSLRGYSPVNSCSLSLESASSVNVEGKSAARQSQPLKENQRVPEVNFKRVVEVMGKIEMQDMTYDSIFSNKRVVVFGLPGAFTPTCSKSHLPGFERLYDDLISHGVDDIYCLSVNDPFVMHAWFQMLNISKVKPLADGNAVFSNESGMTVDKSNIHFGPRSWRYSMVVKNGVIEKMFVEDGIMDLAGSDPFVESKAENMLEYLNANNSK